MWYLPKVPGAIHITRMPKQDNSLAKGKVNPAIPAIITLF
jgi:hypothetical protein